MQPRSRRSSWASARTFVTDPPGSAAHGSAVLGRFQWRVRPVDETGNGRPWSQVRSVRTPIAVSANPVALKAFRSRTRVTCCGVHPNHASFLSPTTRSTTRPGETLEATHQVRTITPHSACAKERVLVRMVTANNAAGESPPSKVFVRR